MILLERAQAILTLAGPSGPRTGAAMRELGILEDASLLVQGDRIAWIGPSGQCPADRQAITQIVDCEQKTIMPAFCDPHTHLVWGGHRKDEMQLRLLGADYETIFAQGGGILSSVRQTRELDEDELFAQSLSRITRMRSQGTTSFEVKSGYGLDLASELRQLRVARRLRQAGFRIKATCLAAHAIPAEHRDSPEGRSRFVELICHEILPAVAEENLAEYCDVFCDRGAFTVEESRKILLRGRELGMDLRVHANELGSTGGAELAAELKAVSADHLLHLQSEEIRALRMAGTIAILLPGTSLVLGKPFARARDLIEQGVFVAIASDCNPGSCAIESMPIILGLACFGCRMLPQEAICAATHNAACSLALQDQLGRLEPGMLADLLVLDTPDYRDLAYHAGSPLVSLVMQAGSIVA